MSNKIKNKQLEIISDFDINNNRLLNVETPSINTDGVNKGYVDLKSINAALGTGLYAGGDFYILDDTHFFVSGGTGFIVDPVTKYIQEINWDNFTNEASMPFGPTDITISIGIRLDGVGNPYVYQQIPKFSAQDRNTTIVLGEIFIHPTTRVLYDNLYMPIWSKDVPSIIDIHINQGPVSIEGNSVSANGNNLYLDVSAGKCIGYSINSKTDITVPNESTQEAMQHIHFYGTSYYNDGVNEPGWIYFGDPLTYDNIDPGHWSDGINWVGGQFTLRSSTSAKYNIRILCRGVLLGGTYFMVYPTQPNEYQNIVDAESALFSLGVNIPNELTSFVVPLCYIILRGNATNLSNPEQCKIIPIQSISTTAGSLSAVASSVSYTGSGAINLSGISNVEDALTTINNKIEHLDYVLTNLDMTAISGTSIHLATSTPLLYNPKTIVIVEVNGVPVKLGDGIKTNDCFFSNDGGLTARTMGTIQQNDYLYWNEDTATYPLELDDKISFIYMYF